MSTSSLVEDLSLSSLSSFAAACWSMKDFIYDSFISSNWALKLLNSTRNFSRLMNMSLADSSFGRTDPPTQLRILGSVLNFKYGSSSVEFC